jgi:hypothetical protein
MAFEIHTVETLDAMVLTGKPGTTDGLPISKQRLRGQAAQPEVPGRFVVRGLAPLTSATCVYFGRLTTSQLKRTPQAQPALHANCLNEKEGHRLLSLIAAGPHSTQFRSMRLSTSPGLEIEHPKEIHFQSAPLRGCPRGNIRRHQVLARSACNCFSDLWHGSHKNPRAGPARK